MGRPAKKVSLVHLITYASDTYYGMAQVLSLAAINLGFRSVRIYDPRDLDDEFNSRNKDTLDLSRGSGYWLWKPKVILMQLQKMEEDEILLYLDCGVMPQLSAEYFETLVGDSKIHLWASNESYLDWTEPKVIASFPPVESLDNRLIFAGMLLAKNTPQSREFITEWLSYCELPELLRPETIPGYTKESSIKWHRHDQSLLNIIVRQHPQNFRIHGKHFNSMKNKKYFDIHRNLNVRSLLIISLFPNLRNIRHKLVNLLPENLRIIFRSRWAKRMKRNLDSIELSSISRGFDK